MLTYDTQSRAISQACIHNSYKIFMFLRTPSHTSNPSSQGKGFSFRRPDSLVESALGLFLPYCRTEHHNPSYEGDLLPPHLIHVREKRSRHHELFCGAICQTILRGDQIFIFFERQNCRLQRCSPHRNDYKNPHPMRDQSAISWERAED